MRTVRATAGFALGELEREFRDGAERSELIQCRAADFGLSPGHDDASPFLEEPPCRGQADPAGPPHDQASAAVEPAGTWHVRTPAGESSQAAQSLT